MSPTSISLKKICHGDSEKGKVDNKSALSLFLQQKGKDNETNNRTNNCNNHKYKIWKTIKKRNKHKRNNNNTNIANNRLHTNNKLYTDPLI